MKKGFIVKEIYPIIGNFLQNRINNNNATQFLSQQPSNILDMLKWESKKYRNTHPSLDPIPKDYINTRHPKILMVTPRRNGGRKNMTPMFYACPHCGGRLFWNMPYCGWCGEPATSNINMEDGPETFLNLIDYIYPQSDKPNLSNVISGLVNTNNFDEKISSVELRLLMKEIEKYIPAVAYTS